MMPKVFRAVVVLAIAVVGASAQAPNVPPGSVVNAASNALGQAVTPGSLVSIYGTNLATGFAQADSVPLSTNLNNVQVTFNGIPAPLLFVVQGQINAQLPWNVLQNTTNNQASLVVNRNGTASQPVTVPVATFSPGIFTVNFGVGQAIAYNHDDGKIAAPPGSIPGATTAAIPIGGVLEFLATGLDPVDGPPIANGANSLDNLRQNTTKPVVLIGGIPAQVLFSGLSPQFVGVNQLDVFVPEGVTPGDTVPIQIQVGGITSTDKATIAVRPKP